MNGLIKRYNYDSINNVFAYKGATKSWHFVFSLKIINFINPINKKCNRKLKYCKQNCISSLMDNLVGNSCDPSRYFEKAV